MRDMAPKVHVWNTGNGGDNASNDPFGFVRQLMTSVSPILDVLQQQTNVAELGLVASKDCKASQSEGQDRGLGCLGNAMRVG